MGMIASNAQMILDARRKGFKPAELILVSLIGRLNEPNHTVYASPKNDYEWSWTRDLQICIYATSEVQWRGVARSIAIAEPSFLAVWDADRKQGADIYLLPDVTDIEKPKSDWRWNLDFLPWLRSQNEEFAWN